MKALLLALALLGILWASPTSFGAEPKWERGTVRFGADREKIQNTHILHRPYRPFHFYGNTVRRLHYRGRVLPAPREIVVISRL